MGQPLGQPGCSRRPKSVVITVRVVLVTTLDGWCAEQGPVRSNRLSACSRRRSRVRAWNTVEGVTCVVCAHGVHILVQPRRA